MSYLAIAKKVLAEIEEREARGRKEREGSSTSELPCRPEVLEMKGALIEMFNERAAILEYEAGFPRAEGRKAGKDRNRIYRDIPSTAVS